MARWRRIAGWAGAAVTTLALVALIGAVWTVRRGFPEYDGQLRIEKHLLDIYRKVQERFPGKKIVIGESGWPSDGRIPLRSKIELSSETPRTRRAK